MTLPTPGNLLNFRPVVDGALYRSEALDHATEAELDYLQKLGVDHVADLRTPNEHATRVPASLRQRPWTISSYPIFTDEQHDQIRQVVGPESGMLSDLYVMMSRDGARSVVEIARYMVSSPTHGVLVHCQYGKDRTGIVVALLLGAAGWTRKAIIDDYVATQNNFAALKQRVADTMFGALHPDQATTVDQTSPAFEELLISLGMSRRAFDEVTRADVDTIVPFLEHVENQPMGAASILLDAGLTQTELQGLRTRLQR